MDLTEDIGPVTALERGAADLIKLATARGSPIVTTQNGRPTAVLQDRGVRRASMPRVAAARGPCKATATTTSEASTTPRPVDTAIRDRLAAHRDQA